MSLVAKDYDQCSSTRTHVSESSGLSSIHLRTESIVGQTEATNVNVKTNVKAAPKRGKKRASAGTAIESPESVKPPQKKPKRKSKLMPLFMFVVTIILSYFFYNLQFFFVGFLESSSEESNVEDDAMVNKSTENLAKTVAKKEDELSKNFIFLRNFLIITFLNVITIFYNMSYLCYYMLFIK